jgi:hypothetical protein
MKNLDFVPAFTTDTRSRAQKREGSKISDFRINQVACQLLQEIHKEQSIVWVRGNIHEGRSLGSKAINNHRSSSYSPAKSESYRNLFLKFVAKEMSFFKLSEILKSESKAIMHV